MHLYHRLPNEFRDGTLYPLNQLRFRYPDLYAVQMRKYQDRPWLVKEPIPPLKCLWGDVIFLTAVPPAALTRAWKEAGVFMPFLLKFITIRAATLDPAKATVFLNTGPVSDPDQYRPFDANALEPYQEVPERTLEHYRERTSAKQPLFIFESVPHILYRGTIQP